MIEASSHNSILPEEQTDELKRKVIEEEKRKDSSMRSRVAHAKRLNDSIVASPPSHAELFRQKLFIDRHTLLPTTWDESICRHEIQIVDCLNKANVFITTQPWAPETVALTWAATLLGSWVLTPSMITDGSGPALKYKAALLVKRSVWVSDMFRSTHPHIWLVILESIHRYPAHKWNFIQSAADYAQAKVKAIKAKHSSQVLALCTEDEVAANKLVHVFSSQTFLSFIKVTDAARTTLGLAGM